MSTDLSTRPGTLTPVHARFYGSTGHSAQPRAGRGGGATGRTERAELARTLGAELRAIRGEIGMTQVVLALRAGVSRRGVQDLEAGRRRPSLAMLEALAVGASRRIPMVPGAADEASALLARLQAAAGGSLVVDTPGGRRRRTRHLRAAAKLYTRECRVWWAGECAAARQAELAFVAAIRVLDRSGALDNPQALAEASQHLDTFRGWLAQERLGPWGRTPEFAEMARQHGFSAAFPAGRRRAA